jgi:hypothetical protein
MYWSLIERIPIFQSKPFVIIDKLSCFSPFRTWKMVRQYSRKFVISEYVLSDGILYKIKKESAGDFRFCSLLPIICYKRVRYKWSRLYVTFLLVCTCIRKVTVYYRYFSTCKILNQSVAAMPMWVQFSSLILRIVKLMI